MIFNLRPLDYIIKKQLQLHATTHLMYICNICDTVDLFISVELYLTVTHSTCGTSSANGNY